ncbi:hypothetical protein CVT24_010876 [Panaeolus cyanescens]|uniref:DUF6589 domain-containing protein n=1 Tax=Panaeolus cyanescens TaxID=181874 RepID=A0A409WDA9_9AGAR|nr:hypothetical protein CVT24_010876 [Panaeolus cyanescens]
MSSEKLMYDFTFWNKRLGPEFQSARLENKLHLCISLLIYLSVPLLDYIEFLFTSKILAIRRRTGRFMGLYESASDKDRQFPPAVIFRAWHDHFPSSLEHIHTMLVPCIKKVVHKESDNIITDKSFTMPVKQLTYSSFDTILSPGRLESMYRERAPVLWSILETFVTAPNRYRRENKILAEYSAFADASEQDLEEGTQLESDILDEWELEDDPNLDVDDSIIASKVSSVGEKPKGFSRNPVFAILVSISMLAFVRNRATNVLPLLCGLFFKIEGASSRVMKMLSNIGLCVSLKTVERVKEIVSTKCREHAVELMLSEHGLFCLVFDNINLYQRKYQQRITNKNSMIHATNTSVIRINQSNIDKTNALRLDTKLSLRGRRAQASFHKDILPTKEDDTFIQSSFENIIAEFIVRYTPGSGRWTDRKLMLDQVHETMPRDRPIPLEKTDTRPFGVFDVNEGSKKGIIELLEAIRQRANMTSEQWSGQVRILLGDWLSSNNFRHARSDRRDDIDSMERLEYGEEVSQLFHFALQATQMIMRSHYGNAVQDPTSLAAHKGLLNRVWDVNSANYAAAKSLIRHSLIARIMHIVIRWSDLSDWRPSLNEIRQLSSKIFKNWATTTSALAAKAAHDDWSAHEAYFIRDALMFCEFEQAVAYADPGRVLRVMRYWCLGFRGAGQHNYARECAEILLHWKYEMTPDLREAVERSWFVNRWGEDGRWIATDLYLEHLNLLVKRVYIAEGNGVTVDYIINKGSACVEAFRSVSHKIATYFGDPDRSRTSKELAFQEDIRALVDEMQKKSIHQGYSEHFVPVIGKAAKAPKKTKKATPESSIIDVWVTGAGVWQTKFDEFKRLTAYDSAVGYPIGEFADTHDSRLDNGTIFDQTNQSHIEFQTEHDLDCDTGGVGGGNEFGVQ